MGNSSSTFTPIPLQSSVIAAPLDPSFVYETEMGFKLQQNCWSFSGRDFVVEDKKGAPFLRFDGKAMSLSGKVLIYDVRDGTDKHIFTLRPKVFTMHSTMRIEKADVGNRADRLETSEATFMQKMWSGLHPTYYLFRRESKVYKIEGNFFQLHFTFYDDAKRPVAQSGRGFWQLESQNNYQLRCAPGADTLLCLICMVCIDIVAQKKTRRS